MDLHLRDIESNINKKFEPNARVIFLEKRVKDFEDSMKKKDQELLSLKRMLLKPSPIPSKAPLVRKIDHGFNSSVIINEYPELDLSRHIRFNEEDDEESRSIPDYSTIRQV
jgi:hypothetical protein